MGFLGIFIFIIFLFAYFRKRQTRMQNDVEQTFWERENEANNARRKDLNGLSYITIPLDKFPIGICKDDELQEHEETLTTLSTQKILNLGFMTNTELKLQYGPSNLDALTQYEQNFTVLCRTLVSYAKRLIALSYHTEAQTVLEFGLSCGSDLSQNFLLLADLYKASGNSDALNSLLEQANTLESPMKSSILTHLEEKMVS